MAISRFVVILNLLSGLSSPAWAEVIVKDAWVRATIGASKVTAAYAIVVNTGPSDDVLIEVSTPMAGVSHIHLSAMTDGIMRMEPVAALPIPANSEVALSPGGYHVMIVGVNAPLVVNDRVSLTLKFRDQGDVKVGAVVMPMMHIGGY